jgi:hypothetical protein
VLLPIGIADPWELFSCDVGHRQSDTGL